jgi:quercetin dioxygenase-like cupin family protein
MPSVLTARAPLVLPRGEGEPLDVIGDRQTVKVSAEATDGAFVLVENLNEPGVSIPMHVHHDEDETFYVVSGQVEFTLADGPVVAEAGTTVFLPKGTPHAFRVVGDGPARMLTLLVPGRLEGLFRELAALPPGPPDPARLAEMSAPYGIEFLPPAE